MIRRLLIIGSAFIVLTLGLLGASGVLAQEDPGEIARTYGVTFPISELGSCENYTECRTYCEDPVNFDACVDYAKDKGFYKGEDEDEIKTVLTRARQTLGCQTPETCRAFCDQEENFDRCHRFAQSTGLAGGYVEDPAAGEVLSKAKEALGCESYNSCKNFCDNPANRDKCGQFAQEVGVRGGYEYRGPGGCTTEETCRSFCSNPANVSACQNYSQSTDGTLQGDPAAECSKYGCSWTGSYWQCTTHDAQYLERMKTECTKYPGCSWGGSSCQCSTSNINYSSYSGDPAAECIKYSSCKWENNSCQCGSTPTYTGGDSGSSGSYATPYPTSYSGSGGGTYATPYSGSGGSSMTREQQESTCNAGGGTCTWNNDTCNCQGYSSSGTTTTTTTTNTATQCNSYPGCSWSDGGCHCSSVQGAATVLVRSWFDSLIDFLLKR